MDSGVFHLVIVYIFLPHKFSSAVPAVNKPFQYIFCICNFRKDSLFIGVFLLSQFPQSLSRVKGLLVNDSLMGVFYSYPLALGLEGLSLPVPERRPFSPDICPR